MPATPKLLTILATATLPALCGEAQPDKSGFTLFRPVPDVLLRDFDADRPNRTNSPHTVDAGHFQIEMDMFSYAYQKEDGIRTETWNLANANLRIGLLNWADLQLLVPIYQTTRTTDLTTDQSDRASGTGDLTIALKMNAWGNDNGDTAGGFEFYVKTPTAPHNIGNGKTEGGVLGLLDFTLPGDIDLGFNSGAGISANDGGGYHTDIINSVCATRSVAGPLSAYLEFASSVPSNQSREWQGSVDIGLLLMVGKNVQLDTGVNLGVTHATDDVQTFLGLSARF